MKTELEKRRDVLEALDTIQGLRFEIAQVEREMVRDGSMGRARMYENWKDRLDKALAQSGDGRVPDITNGLEVTFDPRKLPRKPCRIRIDAAPEPSPEKNDGRS